MNTYNSSATYSKLKDIVFLSDLIKFLAIEHAPVFAGAPNNYLCLVAREMQTFELISKVSVCWNSRSGC